MNGKPLTAVVLALSLIPAAAGCSLVGGVPVLEPPDRLSAMTADEALDDTMRQVNDLAVFLGGPWSVLGQQDVPWDPTDRIGWGPDSCGMDTDAAQYGVDIQDVSPQVDPGAQIAKVRAYWNKLGYHDISQIGPLGEQRYTQIAVFLPASAGLEFTASTKQRSISVQSECGNFWNEDRGAQPETPTPDVDSADVPGDLLTHPDRRLHRADGRDAK